MNESRAGVNLTVFAAASLAEVLPTLGEQYQAEHPDVHLVYNFAGSQQLAQQLAQGAAADLFASASRKQIDELVEIDLVDPNDVAAITHNRLVVVFPKHNPKGLDDLHDLADPGIHLVIADRSIPAGLYAEQFLSNAAAHPDYGPEFSAQAVANIVSYEENVRAVLAKVALGEADAGIVYQSDLHSPLADQVSVLEIPAALNVTVDYYAAPLVASPQHDAAAKFIDFLLSPAAQEILIDYGFQPQQ